MMTKSLTFNPSCSGSQNKAKNPNPKSLVTPLKKMRESGIMSQALKEFEVETKCGQFLSESTQESESLDDSKIESTPRGRESLFDNDNSELLSSVSNEFVKSLKGCGRIFAGRPIDIESK